MQVGFPYRLSPLALAAALAAAPSALAQAPGKIDPTLQEQLNRWFSGAARSARGEWGVAVADSKGQLVWGVNATRQLIPASTVKLFTTGYARSVLGGEARQLTRVLGVGTVDATGTWLGTWALEVNGDPTLERPLRTGPTLSDLATQLADRGIRRLIGPLSVQSAWGPADAAWPTAWAARHRGRRFAPLVGEVLLNENMVTLTVAPGSRSGAPPRVSVARPEGVEGLVDMKARTVAGRRNALGIRQLGDGRFVVTGTIGTRARTRTWSGPSNNPAAVLEASWAAALAGAGIDWVRAQSIAAAASAAAPQTLAEVVSAPFDSIATEVNARSLNVGAEALLRWAAGSVPDAAAKLTEHVRQVIGAPDGVYLADGSGLSSEDRASPWAFVTYMARFPTTPAGRNFPLLFPANGSGTLRRLANGLPEPGVVRAKTGTLGNAATLTGYLGHKDGLILISVMYNGPNVYAAKQQQWRLFRLLGANGSTVPGDSSADAILGGEDKTEPPAIP